MKSFGGLYHTGWQATTRVLYDAEPHYCRLPPPDEYGVGTLVICAACQATWRRGNWTFVRLDPIRRWWYHRTVLGA